jgi:hypothetical protein
MDSPIKKLLLDSSDLLRVSVMEPTDLTCRTAECPDGTIRTQFAEEDQVKRRKETASIDQVLLLRHRESATEPTDLTCRTAECPDGTIRTQSAEEDQVKRRKETASIDQVPSLRLNQRISKVHLRFAMDLTVEMTSDLCAEIPR